MMDVHVNIPIGGKVTSGDDDKIHHPMKETNSLDELGGFTKVTAMLSVEEKAAVSEAIRDGSSQRHVDNPDPTEHEGMEPERGSHFTAHQRVQLAVLEGDTSEEDSAKGAWG